MQQMTEVEIGQYFELRGDFARSRKERRQGLSRKNLSDVTNPMIFEKCRSIHTFGMRFDLQIIFLDIDNRVLGSKIVPPSRLVFAPKGTHTIVEIAIR